MRCPVCTHSLSPIEVAGLTVDACSGGCGGIWFDAFELKKLETPHVAEGFSLLDISINPIVQIDHRRKRPCPRCDEIYLRRHLYTRNHQVEVDSCPNCNGYWLDVGELNQLRRQQPEAGAAGKTSAAKAGNSTRRPTPVQSYYREEAAPQLRELKSHGGEDARQARWIDSLLRFVLPGK